MPRTVKTLTRLPVKCCWSFLREAYFREQFDMFDNDDIYFQLVATLSGAFQIKGPC